MDQQTDFASIGSQLGTAGVDGTVAKVEAYCAHETRRIALENHAPIIVLKAEFSLLVKQAESVEDALRDAPPPGDLRHFKRKKIFAGAVTVILISAGFCLAVLTFAPYRLGWPGYVFSLGLTTVVPFLVERLLDSRRIDAIVKSVTTAAAAAGIASLMLLASVRGHLLEQEIESAPAVVIDDAQPAELTPQGDFYGQTLNSIRLATILLSFAMELGAGLALREALAKEPHSGENWTKLREDLATARNQMVLIAGKITRLEDEPGIFEARLWRDFYGAMLTHTIGSQMRKLLLVLFALFLLPVAHAAVQSPLNLVVALDLSRSVDVKGPDGKTEFQKNVEGVTRVLAEVPAGSHVTVIGITNRSFTQPHILLTASLPEDAGYFGERLNAARRELALAWKRRSRTLAPTFTATDIVGALQLASQIFYGEPSSAERKMLVLFSDMQNDTPELDLESSAGLTAGMNRMRTRSDAMPKLSGVNVRALGVEVPGSSIEKWTELEQFWRRYLFLTGATLDRYLVLRQMP